MEAIVKTTFGMALVSAAVLTSSPSVASAASCGELVRLARPNTTVTSAQPIAAGQFVPPGAPPSAAAARTYAALPSFCRIAATLSPTSDSDIRVEVWLPASGWNGKLQAVGNGGMAGTIPYAAMAAALAAGYATTGTDTGHVGNNADFVPGHPEKLVDFAYRAIHEMAVAAKAVVPAFYGSAPRYSYFNGCSQGGRQGITSAQRYPEDFDGIVAGASAWNSMRMHGARLAVNQIMNRTAESAIPASKYPMIHEAVLQACDALDGVKDGVLENPTKCSFDPRVLACNDADGPSCLTVPQVESARAMISPLRHPATGTMLFEGHLWPGAELEWDTIGGPAPLNNAVTALKNIAFDPSWNPSRFSVAADMEPAVRADNGLLASDNANLKPFFDRGGKLLMWHGWADPQVTPQNSTIYFNNVLTTVGKQAEASIALFMLPGVYHCQGGPGPDRFDRMAAIEQWVEQGRKPTRIVASRIRDGKVDRTRPLCPFGQVARWNGTGSTDDEANFACVAAEVTTTTR
jgi:tannase/feruloyl esterase